MVAGKGGSRVSKDDYTSSRGKGARGYAYDPVSVLPSKGIEERRDDTKGREGGTRIPPRRVYHRDPRAVEQRPSGRPRSACLDFARSSPAANFSARGVTYICGGSQERETALLERKKCSPNAASRTALFCPLLQGATFVYSCLASSASSPRSFAFRHLNSRTRVRRTHDVR